MFGQNDNFLNTYCSTNETEMLQTDIQRFLAILAFCLLPIFMLVQSIPVVSHEKDSVINKLTRRIEEQGLELDRLKKENKTLYADMNRLLEEPEVSERLQPDLKNAMERIEAQRKQIEAMLQVKVAGINDVGELKRQLLERDRKIEQLNRENDQLFELERAAKESKSVLGKDRNPKSERATFTEGKGLYVAFESDRIFLDLLESEKIQLFIHVAEAKQTFRVIRANTSTRFESGGPVNDLDLWEIKEIMVPRKILDGFRNWSTISYKKRMFVVGLSSELSRQIRAEEVQAGRLIIGRNGNVKIQANGK